MWCAYISHTLKLKINQPVVEHEATTSKIGEDQLCSIVSNVELITEKAIGLIVNGYCKEVLNKLPMEFAVEAQKLISNVVIRRISRITIKMQIMLSIKNLHATIGDKEILRGINLEVKAGEVHAIMGPNGSGKSTLSSVLAGREDYEVTEGEVTFNGKDLLELVCRR
jgi:ABC-type multidrug transport system fused ATPase/permease subunit